MKERYKIVPEVFLFLIKDDHILLLRRFQTGYEDGNYGLPAGHGEEGETMAEGCIREAQEEIGIIIEKENLVFALTQNRWCPDAGNAHARVGFYFVPKEWRGEPTNTEPHKCDDLRYFPLDALPENMVPHVRAAVKAYREGRQYDEYNWVAQP
jgi:ADP-ribose pyrophosphatase YjhB (NUDIX family)